jgi:hypothetical protein
VEKHIALQNELYRIEGFALLRNTSRKLMFWAKVNVTE